jgi:hypothetical protein
MVSELVSNTSVIIDEKMILGLNLNGVGQFTLATRA